MLFLIVVGYLVTGATLHGQTTRDMSFEEAGMLWWPIVLSWPLMIISGLITDRST